MTLSLTYSPCPNDTFVFHALTHGLVDGAPAVDVTYHDVDVTNGMAERGEFGALLRQFAVFGGWPLERKSFCSGRIERSQRSKIIPEFNN